MPLSWDDPATREAIARYERTVRDDAPWCPSNLEFIRRVNGLPDIDAVQELFLAASYLVLGLGDVYLGAPVATPLDPRHRMVTTKYNPARTWTPENAVGIGGAYAYVVVSALGPTVGKAFLVDVALAVCICNADDPDRRLAPGLLDSAGRRAGGGRRAPVAPVLPRARGRRRCGRRARAVRRDAEAERGAGRARRPRGAGGELGAD
ncbi:carboxyltransferase domain-containing protein [Sorangium sp. So ce321]